MPSLILTALTLCTALGAQDVESVSRAEQLYTKAEHRIAMRDGVELHTTVYEPKNAEAPRPILLKRTPYSSRPYGDGEFPNRIGPSDAAMEHNFIVVYQDVRGRWMSDGTYDNMRPHVPGDAGIDESSDTYDTIEWLLANVPNNNGRVGMWGISYPGFYCTAALPEAHPALVASSPQASIGDFFFDDFHHQGAFMLSYLTATPVFGHQKAGRRTTGWYPRAQTEGEDAYEFFLDLGPLSNANDLLGEENFFWRQIREHPNYDSFWQARSIIPHLENVHTATLIVGGWYDAEDLYGPLNIYKQLEKNDTDSNNSLVMGPWSHGDWSRSSDRNQIVGDLDFGQGLSKFYAEEVELPFFLHHLENGPAPSLPEALVYDTGARRWEQFDAWPPANAATTRLHLAPGGKLTADQPDGQGPTEFISDPANPVPYREKVEFRFTPRPYMGEDQSFAAGRDDVLVFATEPLDDPVTIAGPLTAKLTVSTTGTDSDWIVKLIDGHPEASAGSGAPMHAMVRSEVARARFRNSLEKPEAFTPNEPTRVDVSLQDVLHTFKRGHRIVIHVQSTWFPLIDRNPQTFVPNIFEATEGDFQAQTHRVFHSAEAPSVLEFEVLPVRTGSAQEVDQEMRRTRAQQLIEGEKWAAAAEVLRAMVEKHDTDARAWALLGTALHKQQMYEEALAAHTRAAGFPGTGAQGAYDAACACARLGRTDDAFGWLGTAATRGWGTRADLVGDPELESLRDDPRIATVLPPLLEGPDVFVEPTRVLHTFVGEGAGDQFGWVARAVGDLDGDGAIDFAATAPSHAGWAGAAYVYSSRSGELLFRVDGRPGARLGNSVEGQADVDGDGTDDVIVGAPGWANAPGFVQVVSGKTGELIHELTENDPGDRLGMKVSAIEDLDGDGSAEIAAGAPGKGPGVVHVYSGRTGERMHTIEGEADGDQFGVSLDGTLSGGHRLLIVGASAAGAGDRGRGYLYRMAKDAHELVGVIDTDEKGANLGQYFAAFLGDVDGDGVDDAYVSDWGHAARGPATGRVYVHSGATGERITAYDGRRQGEGFGTSQATCGDADGDGAADLCVGAWQNADGAPSGGKVYLVSGKTGEDLATWTSKQAGDTLGFDAVGLGDVDGDGHDDFLLTAAWSTVEHGRQGRLHRSGATIAKRRPLIGWSAPDWVPVRRAPPNQRPARGRAASVEDQLDRIREIRSEPDDVAVPRLEVPGLSGHDRHECAPLGDHRRVDDERERTVRTRRQDLTRK